MRKALPGPVPHGMNWALTVGNRDQRQRRISACKTPQITRSQMHAHCCIVAPHSRLNARTWLTSPTAVTAAGEARLLALQVQHLYNILKPPKSA